jgi:hypothetical protein
MEHSLRQSGMSDEERLTMRFIIECWIPAETGNFQDA